MSGKLAAKTVIGGYKQVFVVECELVGLKRKVRALLAERGVLHQDAAKKAGVSRVYWSRIQSAAHISTRELEKLAKGCGVTSAALIASCARPAKRSGT
jgi:transcriptional regulator with XRE-family HTH domain